MIKYCSYFGICGHKATSTGTQQPVCNCGGFCEYQLPLDRRAMPIVQEGTIDNDKFNFRISGNTREVKHDR